MTSEYYQKSVELGTKFQEDNKSWAGYDVVKYQKKIKDLVDRYGAKTILDYGCGKGLQYKDKLPYGENNQLMTFDEFLGVTVYAYDPCVAGLDTPPPEGTKFDGVICTQVLNSIPDDDLDWVCERLMSYADKFCFIGLNFQRRAKGKKQMYDPVYFQQERTREFFRKKFAHWTGSDLFWWWKDRPYYEQWAEDQLNGTWNDLPSDWIGKYEYLEENHKARMALIDEKYKQQLQTMHQIGKFTGNRGLKMFDAMEFFFEEFRPSSVLDFGCGEGGLIDVIQQRYPDTTVDGYDPGSEQYGEFPEATFDCVVSSDVFEHIEPLYLDHTLKQINKKMLRVGFFRIACYPAKKTLPDGRNAHLIVESPAWWREKLLKNMNIDFVHESISDFDRSDKWPEVRGHIYDVVVRKIK